jgi:hypothetical protein
VIKYIRDFCLTGAYMRQVCSKNNRIGRNVGGTSWLKEKLTLGISLV